LKRTAEVTLGIIGSVFYVFSIAFGVLRLWMENNKGYLEGYMVENQSEFELTTTDMDMLQEIFNMNLAQGGILLVIMPILAIILGIVAMVLLKGNKQPVAAGIIFIATAVIYVIVTAGGGILSGLLFLIAGILCLARKPKTIIEG
jgi:lipopolysaccharide export LptBFGC system permease protein LptF